MAFLADRRCDDLSFRGRGGGGPADTPARVEAARHGKTLGRTWEGGNTPTGVHLRTKRFWIIRPQVCARDYQGSCGELRHPAFLFCGTNRCEVPPPTVGDAAMYHPRTNPFLTAARHSPCTPARCSSKKVLSHPPHPPPPPIQCWRAAPCGPLRRPPPPCSNSIYPLEGCARLITPPHAGGRVPPRVPPSSSRPPPVLVP